MSFQDQLVNFNRMYGFAVNPAPSYLGTQRLIDLKSILLKEVDEIDDIIKKSALIDSMNKLQMQAMNEGVPFNSSNRVELENEVVVDVADLMVDLQVYAGSECLKWGIPMEAVQYIIMASNASKLGADGLPIVNDQGKLEKGPNYWKPEPLIAELLVRTAHTTPEYQMAVAQEICANKRAELAAKG